MKYKTMDANNAVASVAYNFTEICGIYPITPASPMAELVDKMTKDNVNFFGNKVKVVEMQSEAGRLKDKPKISKSVKKPYNTRNF